MDGLIISESPAPPTTNTPVTRQSSALKKVVLPSLSVGEPSPSGSSFPAARERKRTRLSTPTICPLIEADELTSTPRSARVAKLFPGGSVSTPKPLDVLIQRLIEVAKAALVPKSKKTSSIKVDIKSAADILLLTGLIQERASSTKETHPVFEPGRKTVTDPTSALSSAFEFRVSTIAERVDVLSEHISKLVASSQSNPAGVKTAPPPKTPSYASAASKHAPNAPTTSQTGAQANPRPYSKAGSRLRSDHTITLRQQDPAHIAGAEKTIPELIKALNLELRTSKILLKPDD
ncbi:hypothetical protein DFH28DRAFT_881451, partial [Melampsora americana]